MATQKVENYTKKEPRLTNLELLVEIIFGCNDKKGASIPYIRKKIKETFPNLSDKQLTNRMRKCIEKGLETNVIFRSQQSKTSSVGLVGRFKVTKKTTHVTAATALKSRGNPKERIKRRLTLIKTPMKKSGVARKLSKTVGIEDENINKILNSSSSADVKEKVSDGKMSKEKVLEKSHNGSEIIDEKIKNKRVKVKSKFQNDSSDKNTKPKKVKPSPKELEKASEVEEKQSSPKLSKIPVHHSKTKKNKPKKN